MPRSLDFSIPCPRAGRMSAVTDERPWRTGSGELATAVNIQTGRTAAGRPNRPRRRKRGRGWSIVKGLALVGLFAAVCALTALPDLRAAAAAAMPGRGPQAVFGQNHVRVLLMGADRNYGAHGERLPTAGRSDTMILADLDLTHGTAHLCSIPRDTEAMVPGHGLRKINSAYALGGPGLARATVEKLTGITVDRSITVDLDAFKEAVDDIGGVDVTVERPLKYVDHWGGLNIDIPAGPQRLDGEHAMQFVRFRHDVLADIGRARRQQAFMHAFSAALRRPGAIASWPSVVRSVSSHTQTDLSMAQMVALGRFAKNLSSGSLTTETLPGTFHRSRWRPDPTAIKRMTARLGG